VKQHHLHTIKRISQRAHGESCYDFLGDCVLIIKLRCRRAGPASGQYEDTAEGYFRRGCAGACGERG
jgi:hypothetical protein